MQPGLVRLVRQPPNHCGYSLLDLLQFALYWRTNGAPHAGSSVLKRAVCHCWCPCSCSLVCGWPSLHVLPQHVSCGSSPSSSSAGNAVFGAGYHNWHWEVKATVSTWGPGPQAVVFDTSWCWHNDYYSQLLPWCYSAPGVYSDQVCTSHWLQWCSWHSDVAQVLWECFLLYGTQNHNEKGSRSTRHGFVFKCYQLKALRQTGSSTGAGSFRHLWMPALPGEADPGCCSVDLIPFCIYLILFCWRKAVLHMKNIYLPGEKTGHEFWAQKTVQLLVGKNQKEHFTLLSGLVYLPRRPSIIFPSDSQCFLHHQRALLSHPGSTCWVFGCPWEPLAFLICWQLSLLPLRQKS